MDDLKHITSLLHIRVHSLTVYVYVNPQQYMDLFLVSQAIYVGLVFVIAHNSVL